MKKYYTLFGWTITTDMHFQYATSNPPKHCWRIPILPIIVFKF